MPHNTPEDRKAYRAKKALDPVWVEAQRTARQAWYSRTKEMRNKKAKEWGAQHREQQKVFAKRHRLKSWEKVACSMARCRAVKSGREFSITPADIQVPEYCPVLGIKLEIGSRNRDAWPSVDRIDNTYGYVKGNIRVISLRANKLKSDATLEELQRIVRYMKMEKYNAHQ